MKKPDTLRAALTAALPVLANDPDKMLVFLDKGSVQSTFAPGLSYECAYTLNIILTDFTGDPDVIWVALLMWVRVNQCELLDNPDKRADGIVFEADILDNAKCDLSIKLPLTERVIVKQSGDGMLTITYADESPLEAPLAAKHWQLYLHGPGAPDELIAEWDVP